MQLCEEENCQEEVSILAINYMDRVLNKIAFSRNNLQLLAATCIFLASKLREPSARALPAHILVFYTANSITKRDIMVSVLLILYLEPDQSTQHTRAINSLSISFRWTFL